MKKVLSVLVLIATLFSMTVLPASADNSEISVYLDAKKIEFDVKPQIINGRTMVPIRAIFEKMGAVVEWDADTSTAICTKDDTVVKMTVNSMDMYINDELTKMDISPVVINGRTLAPARYVAEAFEADVQWSQKNRTVVICSKDVYAYADYPDVPDLGRCFDIPVSIEKVAEGFKVYSYICSDTQNTEYHNYLYTNSASVLGEYDVGIVDVDEDYIIAAYIKKDESEPTYYIYITRDVYGDTIFIVMIPKETEESEQPQEPENKDVLGEENVSIGE